MRCAFLRCLAFNGVSAVQGTCLSTLRCLYCARDASSVPSRAARSTRRHFRRASGRGNNTGRGVRLLTRGDVRTAPPTRACVLPPRMNQSAQYSGEAIDRYLAEEEEQAREAAVSVKQEPLTGRIHHDGRPFGGQDREWGMARAGQDESMDDSIDDGGFLRPRVPARRNVPMSQIHEAWSSHPSIAARAPSVAFDPENQPDIKPNLGWYDSDPGEEALKQLATMQSRLNQRLGPEYISNRPGGNGMAKLSYLEGWKAIDLANDVFGFNGWSTSIRKLETDFIDVAPDGRVNCGITAMVRVSLRDGTFHDDVGYGHCENIRGKAAALEKAKKEAVTDGMKRALRTFGRLVGNCLYDKKYTTMVAKMAPQEEKYSPADFHRRSDSTAVSVAAHQQRRPQAPPQPQPQEQASSSSRTTANASTSSVTCTATTPTTPTAEEVERIRAERQAIAAQRQAAFRQRQEEQKREAAAALERQKNGSASGANTPNGNIKMEITCPASTTSSPATTSAHGPPAPPRLKRAPAAPLPTDPAPTVSDHPASRVFAKEPGAKWSQRATPVQSGGDYDESDLSAVVDSWDGGLSQEAQRPGSDLSIKRQHESSQGIDRQPLRNRDNQEGAEAKRRRV